MKNPFKPTCYLLGAGLFVLITAGLSADSLSPEERQRVVNHLMKTEQMLLAALEGVSENQAQFKPGPFRWTIAQCLEHIVLADRQLARLITERLAQMGGQSPEASPTKVDGVLEFVVDRDQKFQAPESVRPTGSFASLGEALDAFRKSRAQVLEFVRTTQLDLHRRKAPNPAVGEIDAYEWLFFLSGHAERHLGQIQETKSHPEIPKN